LDRFNAELIDLESNKTVAMSSPINKPNKQCKRSRSWSLSTKAGAFPILTAAYSVSCHAAFVGPPSKPIKDATNHIHTALYSHRRSKDESASSSLRQLFSVPSDPIQKYNLEKSVSTFFTTVGFSALFLTNPLLPHLPLSPTFSSAHAEDELYAKYGGKGLDTSLVDKECLVNKCSLQAKACLQDDPDCRKGLTCTAKCLGDNACITGCFARYGTPNLDGLLKCTIEDNECIKVAILEGGGDVFGECRVIYLLFCEL
jgi:hypothetical protein